MIKENNRLKILSVTALPAVVLIIGLHAFWKGWFIVAGRMGAFVVTQTSARLWAVVLIFLALWVHTLGYWCDIQKNQLLAPRLAKIIMITGLCVLIVAAGWTFFDIFTGNTNNL
ncbi:hypothetical protein ACFLS1_12625 [Verrucomicrobiota bacterium]